MSNPQAFPMTWVKQEAPNLNVILEQRGMSLRDYFAAKAMQGFCSDPDWRQDMMPDETARAAYQQADEMLKAREQ
jgi:hypothetical protein